MAQRGSKLGLALVLVTITWARSSAQPTCQPPIVTLQPCMGFITSASLTPSSQCCTQVASLIQTQAQCLCAFLNVAPTLPFPVNGTQAITLPGACSIPTPSLSQCNAPAGASVPTAGSPKGAPAPAMDTPSAPGGVSPPSTAGVPGSKGGSKAGPTKGQSSSSAISSAMLTPSLFFFLLVVSVMSSF